LSPPMSWLRLNLGRGVVQGLALAIACVVFAVVVAILSYLILEALVPEARSAATNSGTAAR